MQGETVINTRLRWDKDEVLRALDINPKPDETVRVEYTGETLTVTLSTRSNVERA